MRVSCHHFRNHPYLTMGYNDLEPVMQVISCEEATFGEPFHAHRNFSQSHAHDFRATLSSSDTPPSFKTNVMQFLGEVLSSSHSASG